MCIFLYYHNQDCIVYLTSFFDYQIIVFSRVLLYTICIYFFLVQSVCRSTNIYAKYIMIHLQSSVLIYYLFIEYYFFIIRFFPYCMDEKSEHVFRGFAYPPQL